MANPNVQNPNDFKVVLFKNKTDFDFTPEMGCMYDSIPIFGTSGVAGIKAGEEVRLPYHIGNQLATNLAKQQLIKQAPARDLAKDHLNPVGEILWTPETLVALSQTFMTELYTNSAPVAMSETQKLMQQVEELNKLIRDNLPNALPVVEADGADTTVSTPEAIIYKDKAEVIAELTKRGISHNPRDKKADLEKLLV